MVENYLNFAEGTEVIQNYIFSLNIFLYDTLKHISIL